MTQEDGFIEVKSYLINRTPIIKWVKPVIVKRIRLLFDVFAIMSMARDSGVDFNEMDQMEPNEQMAWMVYGGMKSYASLKNKRVNLSIEKIVEIIEGILLQDRSEILETISKSKQIGNISESYQKARNPEGEDGPSKKGGGSAQKS